MVRRASRDARAEKLTDDSNAERSPIGSKRTGTRSVRETSRPKTMSRREMLREKRRRERAGDLLEIIPYDRPQTRADCGQTQGNGAQVRGDTGGGALDHHF